MEQTTISLKRYTYDDYCRLPDDRRYEVLEGELLMAPSPIPLHQRIHRRLVKSLDEYVEKHGCGEVFYAPIDVVFSEKNIVQPDILFISNCNRHIIADTHIQASPDLVIEILSPSTEKKDRTSKFQLYSRYGVQEYWIVNPKEKTVEQYVYRPSGLELQHIFSVHENLDSNLLPGFALSLETVFEDLLDLDG